ncbi:MAG: MarR family transcriptional regulator [Pseudomonadota bacterium]
MSDTDDFDLQDFLPYLLNQAADVTSLEFQRYYKGRYGMLRTEWRVLFHLGRYGTMTAKQISDSARIHKTKVSRAVSALEAKRFLQRERDEADRRIERLWLSKAGQAAFKDLSAQAAKFDQKFMAQVPENDRAALRRCLRVIADIKAPAVSHPTGR